MMEFLENKKTIMNVFCSKANYVCTILTYINDNKCLSYITILVLRVQFKYLGNFDTSFSILVNV